MAHYISEELIQYNKEKNKKMLMPTVILLMIYCGIKYAKDDFFVHKFDEKANCQKEKAAYFPTNADDNYQTDGVTTIDISVDENGTPSANFLEGKSGLETLCFRADIKRGLVLRIENSTDAWNPFRLSNSLTSVLSNHKVEVLFTKGHVHDQGTTS